MCMLKNIISGGGGMPQTPMVRGKPIFIKLIMIVRELLYCPKYKMESASSLLCFNIGVFIHNYMSELRKVSYESLLFGYIHNID